MKHTIFINRATFRASLRASVAVLFFCGLGTLVAHGQASSLNTFSPYTMYGLGDMSVGGSAFNRSMGGAGVALRSPYQFNYRNPASMSVIPRQSAIFNFAGEGKNIYARSATTSTTYNTFNLHDLGLAFPLGKGVGLGFSLTPISSVGYASRMIEPNKNITENIGSTTYNYAGDGGISEVAMHLGVNLAPGLALGASMNYWFGNIERQYNAMMASYLMPTTYRSIISVENQNISKILFNLGMQYTFKVGKQNAMTLGVTYQPRVTARVKQRRLTMALGNAVVDTIFSAESRSTMTIPGKVAAGICFQTPKIVAAFDYSRQNWTDAYEIPEGQNITLGAQQDFRVGFSYTPNMYDIRSPMKRWTYKVGARYSDSYLSWNGSQLHDAAVSLGVDFGLSRRNFTKMGVGIEYGERGSRLAGQVKERYFNFFVAFSLFGDYWFVRPKYN